MKIRRFSQVSDPTPMFIIDSLQAMSDSGGKWFSWEPETIRDEIPGVIPNHRMNIIMAVAALMNNVHGTAVKEDVRVSKNPRELEVAISPLMAQWNEADLFGDTCIAFDGISASFEYIQMPTAGQMMYLVHVMTALHADTLSSFSDEVNAYIAACLFHQGIYFSPWHSNNSIQEKLEEMLRDGHDISRRSRHVSTDRGRREESLLKRDKDDPVYIQVLKVEAARQYRSNRIDLGIRQISSIS